MAGGYKHEHWSSRTAFLLAAIGGAVGLGNIWRFPYEAGENGGGAFVIAYIACVVLISLPILIGELMLGRHGQMDPIGSVTRVARDAGLNKRWNIIGWLGGITAFLVLTFYSMIGGWTLDFAFVSATGGLKAVEPDQVSHLFEGVLSNNARMILTHTLFMGITIFIVGRGVTGGIEKAVTVLMPTFFVMILLMLGYSLTVGEVGQSIEYLYSPRFEDFTPQVILSAVGQAFFSIGIAFGYMLTYGAYLPKDISLPSTSTIIVTADTLVALVGGMMIFPLVFAFGLNPEAGATLIFETLPVAFSQMGFGSVFGTIFFLLLAFAALTSSIAILQPMVSWFEEERNISSAKSALIVGAAAWAIGFLSIYSQNDLAEVYPLDFIPILEGQNFFGVIDSITANLFMPLGGILIAIMVGWRLPKAMRAAEFGNPDSFWFRAWEFLLRFFAPIAVAAILIWSFLPEEEQVEDLVPAEQLQEVAGEQQ